MEINWECRGRRWGVICPACATWRQVVSKKQFSFKVEADPDAIRCRECRKKNFARWKKLSVEDMARLDGTYDLTSYRVIRSGLYVDRICASCGQIEPVRVDGLLAVIAGGGRGNDSCLDCRRSAGYVNSGGYVANWIDGREVLQHRKVMEEYLGRPLTEYETVHHINGNRQDNRITNLQLRIGNHGAGQAYECSECGSDRIKPTLLKGN